MSIAFQFADTADLSLWKVQRPAVTYFRPLLKPETWQRSEMKDRVLEIAHHVSHFTKLMLFVSCSELDLKYAPIEVGKELPINLAGRYSTRYCHLRFETRQNIYLSAGRFHTNCVLKIAESNLDAFSPDSFRFLVNPQATNVGYARWQRRWLSTKYGFNTVEEKRYAAEVETLAKCCVDFLNLDNSDLAPWFFVGFHPDKADYSNYNAATKRDREREKTQREQEKEEQKRKARQEKLVAKQAAQQSVSTSSVEPKTGAGRRVGAVPGVFKGVMFRSQLEIRFVTQLEAKGIRWIYEGERLSEGQYLVDFYLPDLRCWVEVKGRLEPRDDYLLKDVAAYLKRERQETLYVYTQSKAYSVSVSAFKELVHKDFWERLGHP